MVKMKVKDLISIVSIATELHIVCEEMKAVFIVCNIRDFIDNKDALSKEALSCLSKDVKYIEPDVDEEDIPFLRVALKENA